MQSRRLVAAVIAFSLSVPALAWADTWDLNIGRLCQIETTTGKRFDCGGGYTPAVAQTDPVSRVLADNAAFRSLMSELGAVFAPNILSPSDTRGWSGFNASVEFGWTGVSTKKISSDPNTGSNYFWRAAGSVTPQSFTASGGVPTEAALRDDARFQKELPPGFAPTVTLMMRKGLWFPVPSFELGVGVRHLIGSTMWAPLATAKIALHEGFHGWPIPSLAVRGMGTRVMNTPGFNLTLAALDFSVSKHFGIASTFNLTPYAGYQLLWIMAASQVIDATPGIDAVTASAGLAGNDPTGLTRCAGQIADCKANFVFADQSTITRHRFFVGLKANFYIVSLLAEYTFFASGSSSDQIVQLATGQVFPYADASSTQHTFSFAIALDY
jgi:hypothetical protein